MVEGLRKGTPMERVFTRVDNREWTMRFDLTDKAKYILPLYLSINGACCN